MRISNKMITKSYTRQINNLSTGLNKLNNQVTSGRKFSKSSEDTAAAVKAFEIRRNMCKIEDYQDNIGHAKDYLSNTESALTLIQGNVQNTLDKIRYGMNGSQSEGERKIIAAEIKTIQDEMLQTLNTNSTGVYLFAGTSIDKKPFVVNANGDLTYNGQVLKDLDSTVTADATIIQQLTNDSLNVDIGLGLAVTPTGTDPNSVFSYSISGINIMAPGTTTINGQEVPNNLYNLLGEIVNEFDKEDGIYSRDKMDALFGKLEDTAGIILNNITKVGAKGTYLDFMNDRYEGQYLNMQDRQVAVEGADPTKTIISFESQKVAYQAALKMGTEIIQPSIFNFMS